MSNVIPLFGRKLPRNEAQTHFLSDAGDASLFSDRSTLCGRIATGLRLQSSPQPECEACIEAWERLTGWTHPLPPVASTVAG